MEVFKQQYTINTRYKEEALLERIRKHNRVNATVELIRYIDDNTNYIERDCAIDEATSFDTIEIYETRLHCITGLEFAVLRQIYKEVLANGIDANKDFIVKALMNLVNYNFPNET